jgi:flagella basal body P-ring formation protein FlgA
MFVAASDLSRGTVLRGEHLKKEVRRVNPLPLIRSTGKPLPVAESVIGRRLISDLAAGAVLNASHLEPAGSIRKGEQVALHVVSGSARIRLAATAENAGAMGDRIVLRIDGTSKRVAAEVTASGAARIELRTTAREGSEED